MTADPSGMQEPEFNFSKGQGVRIVEGPFTAFVGRVSASNREQKQVPVLISSLAKRHQLSSTSSRSRKPSRFYPRRKAATTRTRKAP
jgi:transcription antitermination factor NusG